MRLPTIIRGFLFVSLAILIVGGPALTQIAGVPAGPLNRPWRMYSGVGKKLCIVEFTDRDEPVDRFEVFAVERPRRSKWFILSNEEEVRDTAKRLCRKLPRADIRVDARCSGRHGFESTVSPTEPLCRR